MKKLAASSKRGNTMIYGVMAGLAALAGLAVAMSSAKAGEPGDGDGDGDGDIDDGSGEDGAEDGEDGAEDGGSGALPTRLPRPSGATPYANSRSFLDSVFPNQQAVARALWLIQYNVKDNFDYGQTQSTRIPGVILTSFAKDWNSLVRMKTAQNRPVIGGLPTNMVFGGLEEAGSGQGYQVLGAIAAALDSLQRAVPALQSAGNISNPASPLRKFLGGDANLRATAGSQWRPAAANVWTNAVDIAEGAGFRNS